MADVVHQGKGTHPKSPVFGHSPVNGRRACHPLVEHSQGLPVKWSRHPVDDKTRCILRSHRRFTPRLTQFVQLRNHLVARLHSRYNFHQSHHRRRIEKMHAGTAFRIFQRGRNRRHGQGRRVGRDDRILTDNAFQFSKHPLLQIQIFDNRLDHHAGVRKGAQLRRKVQPPENGHCVPRRNLALLSQPVQYRLQLLFRPLYCLRKCVVQHYRMTVHGRQLRNPTAHRPCTYNAYLFHPIFL